MKRKYKKFKKPKIEWMKIGDIQPNPILEKMYQVPNSTDDLLPIQRLENLGRKVQRHPLEKELVEVIVGVSHNQQEGVHIDLGGVHRKYSYNDDDYCDEFEDVIDGKLYHVYLYEDDITDYNSLYELTNSGWNNDRVLLHPYLVINDKDYNGLDEKVLWRWDNPNLRFDMGIHNWTKENKERYGTEVYPKEMNMYNMMIKNGDMKPPKMGRNDKCYCGSGLKYKKCCLYNKNVIGVS